VSYDKAINEIQGILTQTGMPPGHAQDVAARLSSAMSMYYDYRINGGSSNNSSTNSENISRANSESAAFRNRFSPPEEDRKTGPAGQAGKDGLWAWAVGATGAAGQDGQDGQQGQAGQDGITTIINGGVNIDLSGLYKAFKDLMKRVQDLEDGKDDKPGGCPKCCKGKFKDKDPCSILEQQANRLGNCGTNGKSICERLKELDKKVKEGGGGGNCCEGLTDRIKRLEDKLSDTVECQ